MKTFFIATIRHHKLKSQLKITKENGIYYSRMYRLYPFSDVMIKENIVTRGHVMATIATNLAIFAAGESVTDIYINGENYKNVVNED